MRPDWWAEAACRGQDPSIFVPVDVAERGRVRDRVTREQRFAAHAFCGPCPVRGPCLLYALENRLSGIYADTTDYDRMLIQRQMEKVS